MYNVVVSVYGNELRQMDYKKAYFSDTTSMPVMNGTDTLKIPLISNREPDKHIKNGL
jgi:hypothetical protein